MNARTFADNSRDVGYTHWIGSGGGSCSVSNKRKRPACTGSATWYDNASVSPPPCSRMPERGVDAVRDVASRNAHADVVSGAVRRGAESPLERRRQRQHLNHLVRAEISWDGRHAVPLEVGGRGHEHAPRLARLAHDETRIFEPADAQREVYPFVHEIDHSIGEQQLARDLRVCGEKLAHQRAHVHAAEQRRRRHREAAGGARLLRMGRVFGFVDLREDAACTVEVARARVGQRDRTRRSLQQTHAEALLERRDHSRHRGA